MRRFILHAVAGSCFASAAALVLLGLLELAYVPMLSAAPPAWILLGVVVGRCGVEALDRLEK